MNKTNLNTQSVLSMKGEGYYSQKTVGAKNAIDKMEVLIEEAFKNIPRVDILRIADFGSADGGTSQEMWFNIIEKIKNMIKLKYKFFPQYSLNLFEYPCNRKNHLCEKHQIWKIKI